MSQQRPKNPAMPITETQPDDPTKLRLIMIGVDFRTAPLELREKISYGEEDAETLLRRLVATEEIDEACLLSTCNRTEIYLEPRDETRAYRTGLEMTFLERAASIEDEGRFYVKRDHDAVQHLLEVSAGLESMVLGEPEILGQVKQATGLAETLGSSGVVLQKLLRTAITAGGRARGETAIGGGAVSFGYAVVDLARNIFRQLERSTVMILGAGDIARQVARSLVERGAGELLVANRSAERARELQELFPQAKILPFEARHDAIVSCDIVVSTTGASEPVIVYSDVEKAMEKRRSRPLLLVDLGVPRNIEGRVGKIGNVFLQDIDSLEGLIDRNLKRRREEIPKVQEILDREMKIFLDWHRARRAEPVVTQLQKNAEKLRRTELDAVRDRFPAETHDELDRLTRTIVRKLLHHPSIKLRRGEAIEPEKISWVRELFKLDEVKKS